jgi:hypothetical protein
MSGMCSTHEELKNECKILDWKPDGNIRHWRRLEDNIEMDFKETGCKVMN